MLVDDGRGWDGVRVRVCVWRQLSKLPVNRGLQIRMRVGEAARRIRWRRDGVLLVRVDGYRIDWVWGISRRR